MKRTELFGHALQAAATLLAEPNHVPTAQAVVELADAIVSASRKKTTRLKFYRMSVVALKHNDEWQCAAAFGLGAGGTCNERDAYAEADRWMRRNFTKGGIDAGDIVVREGVVLMEETESSA